MSLEARNRVRRHSKSSGTARVILDLIADNKNDAHAGAYPTVRTLANDASIDERNVQRAIGRLKRLGELTVRKNKGGTEDCREDRRPNLYIITIECPPECDGTEYHRIVRTAEPLADEPDSTPW